MKVFFHGASVTQQGQDDAYIVKLKNLLSTDIEIISKGYGGCHFSEAGVLTIAEDLDELSGVDVCVLEWNTTVLSHFKLEDLHYVVNVIATRNILPVFLILARLETIENDRESESIVINFCKKNKLPLLDLRNGITASDLRDEVHTSETGALKYAYEIQSWLQNIDLNYYLNRFKELSPENQRNVRIYKNVNITAFAGQTITIFVEKISQNSSITAEIIKGPNSGYINIESEVVNFR